MVTFSLRKMLCRLKKLEDCPETPMPEELSGETFDTFLRIMGAATPDEIEDIPVETLLAMFAQAESYAGVLEIDPPLQERTVAQLAGFHSAGQRRRVL